MSQIKVKNADFQIVRGIKDLTEYSTDEQAMELVMEVFLVVMLDKTGEKTAEVKALLSGPKFDRLRKALESVYTLQA